MNDGFDENQGLSRIPSDVPSRSPNLSPQQHEILRNLKAIGPEIAAYYLDGIKILHSTDLETAASLLAHIAREIDGGLRNILSVQKKEELEFVIRMPNGETLTKEKRKAGTLKFVIDRPGNVKVRYSQIGKHKPSILQSLGVDEPSPLADRWIEVTGKFYEFVHRHGAWKPPHSIENFEPIWREFEDVLASLVGSYLNLLSKVVDRILEYEEPTEEIRGILPNLLESEARRKYFFSKLKFAEWLTPLKEDGWFNPENNPTRRENTDQPGYFYFPRWYALGYVERVATQNQRNLCDETVNLLEDIIDTIINYTDKNGEKICNDDTNLLLIRIIGALPVEKIKCEYITFMGTALKSKTKYGLVDKEIAQTILPKLVHNGKKNLTLEMLKMILEANVVNGQIVAIMEYWLKEALKVHGETLAKLCGIEAAEIALTQIQKLIADGAYSFVRIQMIEDSPSYTPSENYAELLVKFTGMMFRLMSPNSITETVTDLLQESISENSNDYAQRQSRKIVGLIALNAIKHHYADLKQLFWKWEGNPLDKVYLKPGFYQLIEANCCAFDEAEIDLILNWIESARYYSDREEIVALRKREWLTALLETKNEEVVALYKRYKKKNPVEIEHLGCNFGTKIWAGSSSPLTVEELSAMSNTQIADYLITFEEPKIIIKQSDPTEEGLARTLKECVETNPQRFMDDLQPFQDVKNFYQNWMLHGFLTAWRDKKKLDWTALLRFFYQILSSEQFWVEQHNVDSNYRQWTLLTVADLIASGMVNDKRAINAQLLPLAERILLILVAKVEPSDFSCINRLSDIPSSDRSKVFSGMISYALRFAFINDTTQGDCRWPHVIREDFTKRLSSSIEPSLEFSYTLGAYLPDLLYLDEEWVIDNLPHIFPQQDELRWQAAFSGYLSYSQIYGDLYSLLKAHGHYRKALTTDFVDDEVVEVLAEHICVGWVQDWEILNDDTSLIYQLVNSGTPRYLTAVVHFFLDQNYKLKESDKLEEVKAYEKVKAKVRPAWSALFEVLSTHSDEDKYQKVLSPLSQWIGLIDEIDDEVLAWIKVSINYLDKVPGYAFTLSQVIEALQKHVSITPKKVGEIYLEIPKSELWSIEQTRKNEVEETVRTLYKKGCNATAEAICERFAKTGALFLRSVREEYQNQL